MNAKFEVILSDLRDAGAGFDGYNKVVRMLQGREFTVEDLNRKSYIKFAHKDQIALKEILKSNGLDDALWTLRCVPDVDRDAILFAVWCARQVEHLMTDQRSKDALDVTERFANGKATEEELDAARAAARSAAAWAAARAATWAAAESAAAWAAARAAGRAAAEDATESAAKAAAWAKAESAATAITRSAAWAKAESAARTAAEDAARAAAWNVARAAQSDMFIAMCEGRARWQINNQSKSDQNQTLS